MVSVQSVSVLYGPELGQTKTKFALWVFFSDQNRFRNSTCKTPHLKMMTLTMHFSLLGQTVGDGGGAGCLTITMSPVRELARSVTEEWPSASGGWPFGLLAGLLPLKAQTEVDKKRKKSPKHVLRALTHLQKERMSERAGSPTSTCLAAENSLS